LDLNGKNIDFPTTANISDCLDEDNMVSNSATKLATQQSIKAYADTKTTLAAAQAVLVKNDGSVNPTNLLSNGDFENWSAGTLAEAVNQQATNIDYGQYSIGKNPTGQQVHKGQSFILVGATLVTSVEVREGNAKTGTPTGNWTLRIETDDGSGGLGKPSGTLANANASIVVSPPGTNTIIKGTFATEFNLVEGIRYWLVIQCDNQSTNNFWNLSGTLSGSVYANGGLGYLTAGTWTAYVDDLYFKIYTKSWNAPDGWALENTPTLLRDTGDVGYGSYSAKITAAGAGLEGIKFTTGALKPSTKYTFAVRVKATAGDTASIISTGATTNLALESTSATFELKTGTFTTDGSGTAVVIKLLAKADGDIVWFDGAMCVEGESAFAFADKPASEGVYTDYFATSTIVGWAAGKAGYIKTIKIGKRVFVDFNIYGTSDNATTTFTLPIACSATRGMGILWLTKDNGTILTTPGRIAMDTGSIVEISKDMSGADFTASGLKRVDGSFSYESA